MKNIITVEGLSIAYVEINPELNNMLFFIHHNSGSSRLWNSQLTSPDLQEYRMIAIDLPGHGESSASETPDLHYGLLDLGRIVGKVASQLCADGSCIMVGFSVGTNIILEALQFYTPKGVALLGPSIVGGQVTYSHVIKPGVDSSPLFLDTAPHEAITNLFSLFLYSKDAITLDELLEDYQKTKQPFPSTFYQQTVENRRLSDELALLNKAAIPALVVFEREDEINDPDYLDQVELQKWTDNIYQLPQSGHFVHLDQLEASNKLLVQYGKAMFKECHAL